MASRPRVVCVFMMAISCGSVSRLEQDMVGDAHLADIVQRRRLEQQFDILVRQKSRKRGKPRTFLGQRLQIMRSAADMVARLAVARLGQRGHGVGS